MSAELEPTGDQGAEVVADDQAAPVSTGADGAQDGGVDLDALTPEQIAALTPDQQKFHADYTRKTQTLAEQRRELETRLANTTWMENLAEALEQDPERAATLLEGALTQLRPGQQAPAGQFAQPAGMPEAEAAKMQEMWEGMDDTQRWLAQGLVTVTQALQEERQRWQSTAETAASREIAAKLTELHGKYQDLDFDEDAVLKTAAKYGLANDLEAALKIQYFDKAGLKRSGQDEALRARKAVSNPPGGLAVGTKTPKRATSAEDAIRLTLAGQ